MRRLIFYVVALSVCVVFIGTACRAYGMSADEIVEKANIAAYYPGNDGRADVKMTITDAQGRKRIREFRILRLTEEQGGKQKFYADRTTRSRCRW